MVDLKKRLETLVKTHVKLQTPSADMTERMRLIQLAAKTTGQELRKHKV